MFGFLLWATMSQLEKTTFYPSAGQFGCHSATLFLLDGRNPHRTRLWLFSDYFIIFKCGNFLTTVCEGRRKNI